MADAPPATDEEHDASLWDALPGWVLLLTRAGQALHVNPALCTLGGRSRAQLLGAGWRALLTPASTTTLLQRLVRPDDFECDVELLDADGQLLRARCAARWQNDHESCTCVFDRRATPDYPDGALARRSPQTQARLFRLLADNVPALIAYYSASDFRCQFANRQYAQAFGRDTETILGSTFEDVIGVQPAREIQPQVERMLAQRSPVVYERTLPATDGGQRWIEVHLLPHLEGAFGAAVGAFVLINDITRHRVAEQIARESEERLAKFMQASAEGIVFHKDGFITDANPPVCELIGYPLAELLGRKTLEFIASDHVAKVAAVIASGDETAYESMLVDKHGQRIPVEFIVRTMMRGGERLRMTIVRDIRDRHAAQARIHHMAHFDGLTGLPNRVSFMEHLERSMRVPDDGTTGLALVFIDLDNFKRVNDSLGHLVGDALLRTIATRITAQLRATDVVARFGGDEFVVLLADLASGAQHAADAEEVADKLLAAISAPVDAEGRPLSVTPSIGIALYPGHGGTSEELVRHADSAMYLAKARGRANVQFFEPGMAAAAYADLVMEGELAQALERGEFVLYFQPQVRAHDGALVGAEALIRWQHPQRGLLLADEFIGLAEQRQLILSIGQWVLAEALRCALRWNAMGLGVAPIAVNLAGVQFQSQGFIESMVQLLPPVRGLLELELTERMLMDDLAQVKERLVRLKALGLQISVDDFGTGYSSLGHLKELPIDKVKIDRSFVHDLPENRDSVAITRAIIQMGRSLGMTVIAEGVETEAQWAFLAGQGCDELQGLMISEPLPQQAFEDWVVARKVTSAS